MSIRHCKNGRRIIDVLKKKMIEIIRNFLEDGEDYFYLYNPDIVEPHLLHGDQVCAIGNYNTDGWKMNLNIALRQTLYVLMSQDLTHRKYLILVTDRINQHKCIEKAFDIDYKEMIDCNFIFIGVGSNYDKNCFKKFASLSNVTYFHIDEPEELDKCFLKENDG